MDRSDQLSLEIIELRQALVTEKKRLLQERKRGDRLLLVLLLLSTALIAGGLAFQFV